jgi:hypothetical protein
MNITEEQKAAFLKMVLKADNLEEYEYHGKRAKPFISLFLFKQDIAEILGLLDTVILLSQIKQVGPSIIAVFWEKIIITYTRNFTKSKHHYSKFEIAEYLSDADELALHEQMMTVRNTFIAHREENDFEYHTVLVVLAGAPENCHMEISVPTIKKVGHYFDPVKMRRYLKKLFKKVDRQLNIKRDDLERFLFDELQLEANLN